MAVYLITPGWTGKLSCLKMLSNFYPVIAAWQVFLEIYTVMKQVMFKPSIWAVLRDSRSHFKDLHQPLEQFWSRINYILQIILAFSDLVASQFHQAFSKDYWYIFTKCVNNSAGYCRWTGVNPNLKKCACLSPKAEWKELLSKED